jgi:hypothetical protein
MRRENMKKTKISMINPMKKINHTGELEEVRGATPGHMKCDMKATFSMTDPASLYPHALSPRV